MNPEAYELLVASLAEGSSPTRLEAYLRLRMEHHRSRRQGRPPRTSPQVTLELPPEIRRRAEERAGREIDQAKSLGAFFLTPWNPQYPRRLGDINGPPPILYCRGEPGCSLERSVAVVGTLTPTRWGMETAEKISGFLAEKGWTVVSGLAIGIDRHAHEAALGSGATTVAVLGGGLDRISPASHQVLADRMIRAGGCLFSELPFGTPPTVASRVRRDRIQSGISLATVMVESDIDGGAMHTARYAGEQGPHPGRPGRCQTDK